MKATNKTLEKGLEDIELQDMKIPLELKLDFIKISLEPELKKMEKYIAKIGAKFKHVQNLQRFGSFSNILLYQPNVKVTKITLPLTAQIQGLFDLHESQHPNYSSANLTNAEIIPKRKVLFINNAIKGPQFFNTANVLISAARQQAAELPAEVWFTILSFVNLTAGDYKIDSKFTQGYEVLMKLRIITDLYVNRTIPLKNSLSYAALEDIPGEAKPAFFR